MAEISKPDWQKTIEKIAGGVPPEIAALDLGLMVREWNALLDSDPKKADDVENAKFVMLGRIKQKLQAQALQGQPGPAKQVLEAFSEEFQKRSAAERAKSEGTRYVILSDIPPRKLADAADEEPDETV